MNKKYFLATLLLAFSFHWLSAQAVKKGLLAYYPFHKGEVEDQTKNKNNGVKIGGLNPVADRFGNNCSALEFDGNSYIKIPSSSSLRNPSRGLTVAGWFMLNEDSRDDRTDLLWVTMVCKSAQSEEKNCSPQYRLQLTERTVSLNTEFTEEKDQSWNLNQWYHVALAYDGTSVKAYLDGQQYFSYPYFGNLESTNSDLNIGRDVPGNLEYFKGVLDDILIYDRALSAAEVRALARDQSNKTLSFDPCSNDPVSVDRNPRPVTNPEISTPYPGNQPRPPRRTKDPKKENTPEEQPRNEPPTNNDRTTPTPDNSNDDPNMNNFEVTGPFQGMTGEPMLWEGDTVYFQQTVTVKSNNISIYPYDHQKEDGDIISLNINGVWLLDHYSIKNKGKDPRKTKLSLMPGKENYLISKAWNLGSIPPNTLTVEIDDGTGSPQIVTINSEIGKSGAIKIIYEE